MMPAIKATAADMIGGSTDAAQFYNFAKVAQARGATTIVDGGGSTYFDPDLPEGRAGRHRRPGLSRPHRRPPQRHHRAHRGGDDPLRRLARGQGQRQARLPGHQDPARRIEPGLHRTAAAAGLSRQRRQRPVEPRPRGAEDAGPCVAQCRPAGRRPLQRRPGGRDLHRSGGGGAGEEPALRSPPLHRARPASRRVADAPHGRAGHPRHPVLQPSSTIGASSIAPIRSAPSAPAP